MNVRVVLNLGIDETAWLLQAAEMGSVSRNPSRKALAEKIRAAVDAAEVEADEPVYTHDLGGES